ncbi:hypothetical protein HPB52_017910 [Rhipicephalus sanguineus]|uniref:C2H2-type domain-containing protein n=1 Tax=Rhipicephalus sanguineus TaxID=34632 RepID=A0A9D4T7S8_RHISA|nr:hypothetical protein HPB52_017910 [Rhipicephalus sanguineus]
MKEPAEPPAASELAASSGHSACIGTQPRALVADAGSIDVDAHPHKCPHCGKGFAEAYRLRKHIRTHPNERPFKCSYCTKTFSERKYLTLHERRHTGDKPYLCQLCHMAFTCESTFSKHMQEHN